jgi:hypothetical protein
MVLPKLQVEVPRHWEFQAQGQQDLRIRFEV